MRRSASDWSEYVLSLPERALRSASALAGGLLNEIGEATLPASIRRGRLYRSMVEAVLRFLIEQVGEVEGVFPGEGRLAEDFLLRRTTGNGIELIGILAFRASPVWVLAALADLSGAGGSLIREISASLRAEGLLKPGAAPSSMEEILDGLEDAASRTAEAINTPPLDVKELRREWRAIGESWRKLPAEKIVPTARLEQMWREIETTAAAQRRTVFELSSVMAFSALTSLPGAFTWMGRSTRVAASSTAALFADRVLGHYRTTLQDIREQGLLAWWAREFRPYLAAAAKQFSPKRRTWTERVLLNPKRKRA